MEVHIENFIAMGAAYNTSINALTTSTKTFYIS